MKRRIILSLIALLLCQVLSAQTYHFQYSHDTLGNRVSKVYQGAVPSKGAEPIPPSGEDGQLVAVPDGETAVSEGTAAGATADNDTTKSGSLLKSPAEKKAHLDSMMAAVVQQRPFETEAETRSLSEYSVGEIPLEYGVSASGARTYTVPIFTAPDIRYAPSLSLVYNSQGGYGHGGYGWDIGGLSSISLSSQSPYWDNDIKAASSSDYDGVFCLDGIRLVRNTHRATRDSFPLVTATGPRILVGPRRGNSDYITCFKVLFPDGTRSVYGTGTDLGFTLPSYPMVQSTNKDGERIEYCYTLDSTDGNHSIDSIRYGIDNLGNATGAIRFSSTPSNVYSYYAGKKVRRAERITSITSVSGGVALYTYSLAYQNLGDACLLKTVSLTNSSGEQLPPLVFTYGAEATPHTPPDSLKITATRDMPQVLPQSGGGMILRRGKFLEGSYNDGLLCFSALPRYYEAGNDVYACGYEEGQYSPTNYAYTASIADAPLVLSMPVGPGFQDVDAVDVDGDGVDEIVRIRCGETSLQQMGTLIFVEIYRYDSSGSPTYADTVSAVFSGIIDNNAGISPCRRAYHWGDFLGGGRSQLLVVCYTDNGFGESQSPNIALFDPSAATKLFDSYTPEMAITPDQDRRLFCMDIDGDGRTEICVASAQGLKVYRCISTGVSLENTFSNIPQGVIDSDRTCYADINADGYIDIIQAPSSGSGWIRFSNTGESFVRDTLAICSVSSTDACLFMDINRDGYPDLMKVSGTSLGHHHNRDGMSFDSYESGNIYVSSLGNILPPNVVDYTAMSSFVTVDGSNVREFSYTSYAPPMRHLVQSCDSYGKIVLNTYGYLPHSSLYWTENPSGISSANGYQLRVLPLYVLTGAKGFMSAESDAPKYLQESYAWYDGVVHTQGLGFCGFSKTRTESLLDGVSMIGVSRFDPQKRGVPVSAAQYLGSESGTPYHSVGYTFDNNSTTYGKLNPRLTRTDESDDLSGVASTTLYEYDSFNYPTRIATSKQCSVPSGTLTYGEYRSIFYSHANSQRRYILGSISSSIVSKDYDGEGSLRGKRFEYDLDTLYRPVQCKTYNLVRNPLDILPVSYLESRDRWSYDQHGNVIREESAPAGSNVFIGKTYSYDATGRHLVSSTDALGHTTAYSGFDMYGNPSVSTNHKGQQTRFYRDGWGRDTRTVHPEGTVDSLAHTWGGVGVFTETATSSGRPDMAVDYDALGREVLSANKRFDAQWQKVRTYYNERGLVARHSQPYRSSSEPSILGWQWIYHTYDNYGRPTKVSEASGRQTTWSYNGTAVTERKDGVRLTRRTGPSGSLYSVSDSLNTFTYSYYDDGQPSSVTSSAGATVTFTYDTLGRRTAITDPAAGTRTTSYVTNANGSSSVTETDSLGSIVTGYDSLGRVTSIVRPDFNTTYSYDTCGRLVSKVSTNSTSSRYTYDAYDRVVTSRDSVPDGRWMQKNYYYGSDGNVSYLGYSCQGGGSAMESYSYANGTLKQIYLIYPTTLPVFNLTAENDFGQPTGVTSGSVSRSYSYTDYGLPAARMLNNGTLMEHRSFFSNATGNLTNRVKRITGSYSYTSESFSYDNLGRLTSAGSNAITYDATGNITAMGGIGTMSYAGSAHPYTITGLDVSSTSVTGTSSQEVTYTAYDRPATITQGGRSVSFTYDDAYRRVKMLVTTPGEDDLVKYYIGGNYEVICDDENQVVTQQLWLGGDAYSAPVVLRKVNSGSWTPYIIGRDYLGSITHIATKDGTLVEERSFDAWGRLRDPSTNAVYSASAQPSLFLGRGFCGHEHLQDFGLINMNARLYDPLVGRFLSPDPYIQAPDIPGNFNRYSYCLNNPLKYTDEDGEFWNIIIGAAIGGIGNIISNWSTIKQKGFWSGVGYFAVGAGVGALSAVGAGWLAGVSQAAGVWAGALIGSATGAATGAASNALTTIGNNLIAQKDWYDGVKASALQGALWGGISGAVSGGIKGYQYAKEHNANPWTNKIIGSEEEYGKPVKTGVHTQPDPSKHCYGYVAEYADAGHGNHLAEEFIAANGGAAGGDVSILKDVSSGVNRLQKLSSLGAKEWSSFVSSLGSESMEVAGTINSGTHWVNVIGSKSFIRLNWFGGGQADLKLLQIWNPIGGATSYVNVFDVSHFRIFYY